VRHIGHRASRPETASKATGSESTSTIVMGAARDVEAQLAMQNLQRVWRHVVVTGSWSSIWQIGHRSSSSIFSDRSIPPSAPAKEVDGVFSFFTLSRKERCARRAALYALVVGRGSMVVIGVSSTIHCKDVKSLRN